MGVKLFFFSYKSSNCLHPFSSAKRLLMNGFITHYKDIFCSLKCPTEIVYSPIPTLVREILVSRVQFKRIFYIKISALISNFFFIFFFFLFFSVSGGPRATFALINIFQLTFNSWCVWELKLNKEKEISKEQNKPCNLFIRYPLSLTDFVDCVRC